MKITTAYYNNAFWNTMRGKGESKAELNEGSVGGGDYIIPSDFNEKYLKTMEKENVFRRLATVVDTSSAEGKIHAVTSIGMSAWVSEMVAIPESTDNFKQIPVDSYKLASLSRIKENFVSDYNFDIQSYLQNEFARRFGRAEENAFINGDGVDEPTGILNSTAGGEIGITIDSPSSITYDDIIKLYFSLDKEHRRNAVWLMNDETAITLRTLKDTNGNYLWNTSDNTILGKAVEYSTYMPNMESGTTPIAFGDFSYYWIIQRQPLTVKVLRELYSINNEVGFAGYERLDGKLILPEAIKLLKIA